VWSARLRAQKDKSPIWSRWSMVRILIFRNQAHILVAPSSRDVNAVDDWHIFNDFLVQPIPKEEALRFDNWKTPSVLAFQLKTMSHKIDDRWKDQMDTSILHTLPHSSVPPPADLVLLAETEQPKPGTLVGIDSEFVALHKEEIEIKADGSRETVRPSRLGLARVSVLRGDDGAQQDVPFIDDYILTTEPVVDYLTAYSGIHEGDLDPSVSTHPLVTLKMAYKKIWLLLNLGCTFVGHGLLKDFRTINIHVPRGQVIDTVDLWYIRARARKLNLRFLAWLLLNEDVQGGESHDSVEDARTALRLWRKYQEVKGQGNMEDTLEWVYKRGREVGYRAPGSQPPLPTQHTRQGQGSNGNIMMSGTDTTGRNTPDPIASGAAIAAASGMTDRYSGNVGSGRAGAGTPVKKMGFGVERVGFGGSPLR
jgi:PAB-dependent poly(A)-specific ribonuclease subunit 2